MSRSPSVLAVLSIALLVIVAGIVFAAELGNIALADQPDQHRVSANKVQSLTEAIQQVDFDVKEPGWLPFDPTSVDAYVIPIGGTSDGFPEDSVKVLSVDYATPSRWVAVYQLRGQAELISDQYTIEEVELRDGVSGRYMYNGAAYILSWQEGEIHYKIVAGGEGTYAPDALIHIANSLQ